MTARNGKDTLPAAFADLLKRAQSLLETLDSKQEGDSVVSIETHLSRAVEAEMDVDRLRRLSLLLREFERFYRTSSPKPGEDDGELLLEETPFTALLTLIPARSGGKAVRVDDVMETLKARGIQLGLNEPAIRSAVECAAIRRESVYRLPVAAGEPAQDGEDGSISFAVKAFDKRVLLDPDQPFFGDLLALVEEVKAGALVARISPGSPGRPGRDIHGKALPAVQGRPLSLAVGEGLQLLGDGRELHALVRGSLVVGEETLDLVPFHVVDGQMNVGQDISFDGHVLVTGHVIGPVRIQARDIYIAGNAEAASLSAAGDVWVGGSVQGKSAVEAEGRVFARAVSDATVRATGDVFVNSIIESRVASSGRIVARSGAAIVEGGEVSAYRGILAHTLGSSFGLTTVVRVGVEDLRSSLVGELEKRIRVNEELLSKIDTLKAGLAGRHVRAKDLSPDQQALYISMLRKEIEALEELRGLRRRRKRLDASGAVGSAPSLSVTGKLHPPVKLEIGEVSELIREGAEGVVLTQGADRRLSMRKIDASRPLERNP